MEHKTHVRLFFGVGIAVLVLPLILILLAIFSMPDILPKPVTIHDRLLFPDHDQVVVITHHIWSVGMDDLETTIQIEGRPETVNLSQQWEARYRQTKDSLLIYLASEPVPRKVLGEGIKVILMPIDTKTDAFIRNDSLGLEFKFLSPH